jgi:uncharacterized protein
VNAAGRSDLAAVHLPVLANPKRPADPVASIIVKLAARCNLACDYCYWFRDSTVLDAPKLMSAAVQNALVERLRSHFTRHAVPEMTLILHGGEPLLFGKARFIGLCETLRALERSSATTIKIRLTTNGTLVDEEWAALLRYFDIGTTVSIDGPPSTHNLHRPDLAGKDTHSEVVRGIAHLRALGMEPGILAVADPDTSPEATLEYFFGELNSRHLDFLIPDATHDGSAPKPIGAWFNRLFDTWFDRYAHDGRDIRLFQAMIRSLCGFPSGVESIGYGPVAAVTVCTDGALEAHDVVRIAGNGATASCFNVTRHEIDEVQTDPLWIELLDASLQLAPLCRACPWQFACGGGHIASRWSFEKRFNNPSVYCRDLKLMLSHVWGRISPTLTFEPSA